MLDWMSVRSPYFDAFGKHAVIANSYPIVTPCANDTSSIEYDLIAYMNLIPIAFYP